MIRFPTKAVLGAAILAVPGGALVAEPKLPERAAPVVTFEQGGPERPFPPMPGREIPGLRLAGQLAAAGIYLGIEDAQADAWGDYCQALIAFLAPEPPRPGAAPADKGQAKLAVEMMAEDALAQAEKARGLLAAVTALRGTLDAEQLEKLARIEPSFGPGPHGPGPHGIPPRGMFKHGSGPREGGPELPPASGE